MEDDRVFYERRMLQELERARTENSDALRNLHSYWANLYRLRISDLDRREAIGRIGQVGRELSDFAS